MPEQISIPINAIAIVIAALIISASIIFVGNNIASNLSGAKTTSPSTIQTQPTQQPEDQPTVSLKINDFIDDDQKIGNDNAPIVMIEFSDFQCPFCRKFYNETLPSLEKDYIQTGKVQFIYRDFPLRSIHPGAQPAAEAAECGREQGKWREMHNKIFDEQNKIGAGTQQFDAADLKKWASEIQGINATQFNQCLDSGKYADEVEKDYNDAIAVGATGTPSFLIGKRGEDGQVIVGAQPYSLFQQVLDSLG